MASSCVRCHNPITAVQECPKCAAGYCSSECIKADRKKHSKRCGRSGAAPQETPSVSEKPFSRLQDRTYLHGLPRPVTYGLLVDCFRLRDTDDRNLSGVIAADGIYAPGATSAIAGFRRFLDLAESRPGLLPEWWDAEARAECEAFGSGDAADWYSLTRPVTKQSIISHYGNNNMMPMQLRLLGEMVYGTGPGGQPGAHMIAAMAGTEQVNGFASVIGIGT